MEFTTDFAAFPGGPAYFHPLYSAIFAKAKVGDRRVEGDEPTARLYFSHLMACTARAVMNNDLASDAEAIASMVAQFERDAIALGVIHVHQYRPRYWDSNNVQVAIVIDVNVCICGRCQE